MRTSQLDIYKAISEVYESCPTLSNTFFLSYHTVQQSNTEIPRGSDCFKISLSVKSSFSTSNI